MEEIWKDIEDYEGLYQVSNFGRIKSLKRTVMRRNNRQYTEKEKILNQYNNKKGYKYVCLCKEGKAKSIKTHRLVAETFIPNIFNKEQVNHIDYDKANNIVTNLEWVTNKENYEHARKNQNIVNGLLLRWQKKEG